VTLVIKFFGLIPRAQGVSVQEFHDHWRHPHGTFGRLIPTMRTYVQSHQIHTDFLDGDQSQFEGIAEVEFDTTQDAIGLAEDPQYTTYVQPDEPNFVDVSRLEWLFAHDEVLVPRAGTHGGPSDADGLWLHLDRPVSIKLLQFIKGSGDDRWAGANDADLGQRIGALRHVRNYASREVHGDEPAYLGAREMWWPTVSAFEAGVESDREAFDELISQAPNSIILLAAAERFLR
jgi:hypothetical protein